MLKNIQFKIILIYFLTGIIIISGLGIYSVTQLNAIKLGANENTIQIIESSQMHYIIALVIVLLVFIIIGVLIFSL